MQADIAAPAEADASALWHAFAQRGDAQARERLVALYLPFARIMAGKMFAGRTHMQVEFDEYLQFARLGLMEAVDRYDAGLGYKFETYAAARIKGAILSGLESFSDVHEQIAARKRIVSARVASLTEPATPDGSDPAAVFGYLAELAIGLAVGFALDSPGLFSMDQNRQYQDNTYTGVELKQLRARLKSLMEGLPGKQRQVIAYHYMQQLAFEDIADLLQLSKGRVAQIHKEALLKLRLLLHQQQELNWSG